MGRILVVGGAGFIGSHMVLELAAAGREVHVLDDFSTGHRAFVEGVPYTEGDLGDDALLDDLLAREKFDAVFHFAAFAFVGESVTNPAKYYVNNVSSTVTLLNAMLRHGIHQFIFSSTCATYGVPEVVPIVETEKQAPINPYGRTKLMVEQILADYSKAYPLRAVSFRYFNAAGADAQGRRGERHDPETHLIPLVLAAAAGRQAEVKVFGDDYPTPDGTCVRDYIHVTDLAQAHLRGLEYLERGGASDAFNLGNGSGFSVLEIIAACERATGKKIPFARGERRPGDPPVLVGDAAKARRILGWKPEYAGIDAILESAWRWHQRDWSA